jgi:hypothetical protein
MHGATVKIIHNTSSVGGVMGLMPVVYGNGGKNLLQEC